MKGASTYIAHSTKFSLQKAGVHAELERGSHDYDLGKWKYNPVVPRHTEKKVFARLQFEKEVQKLLIINEYIFKKSMFSLF